MTPSLSDYQSETVELIEKSLVIDMLSAFEDSSGLEELWLSNPAACSPEELAKYSGSGINVFHCSPEFSRHEAYDQALKHFAGWNSFLAYHDERAFRVDKAEDFSEEKLRRRVGFMLGVQNSDHFRTIDDVDYFHGLGQRTSQLTYNEQNRIGAGCTERSDPGLSDFGAEIVKRMNEVGMAVDVSHCGEKTTIDAIEMSSKPVVVTHSNCRALNPAHPRCKNDDVIKLLAERGGVFGMTSIRIFVHGEEPTTFDHLLDHYAYAADLVGPEHIGVGTDCDLDGNDTMAEDRFKDAKLRFKPAYGFRDKLDIDGQDHPRRIYNLTEGLRTRGFSEKDIVGILGGNFRRVLEQIWSVAPDDAPASA